MSLLLVKRLVPTELIIFKSLFRDRRVIFNRSGKQKAFSPPGVQLSALYPSLLPTDELTVTMFLHGPGDVATLEVPDSPLAMQAKNWRLGSDINDIRIGSPYQYMRDGDYAVMEFHGEGAPASVDVFLVSAHYTTATEKYFGLSARCMTATDRTARDSTCTPSTYWQNWTVRRSRRATGSSEGFWRSRPTS